MSVNLLTLIGVFMVFVPFVRAEKPLKVYILSGQSNMVGMASAGTLEHIKMDEVALKEFNDIFDADGKPVVMDDVWISYSSSAGDVKGKLGPSFGAQGKGPKIGPEYGFGGFMHNVFQEPVLIIKTMAGIGKGFADAILKLNTNN